MPKRTPHPVFGTGPLSRPLSRPKLAAAAREAAKAARDRQFLQNLDHLLARYGADKLTGKEDVTFWKVRFAELARDCVPGLREGGKRGRPPSTHADVDAARRELLSLAEKIAPPGRRSSVADEARRIRRRLQKGEGPALFRSMAERTLRRHLAMARRKADAERSVARVIQALSASEEPAARSGIATLANNSGPKSRPTK